MRRSLFSAAVAIAVAAGLLHLTPAAAATNTFRCGSALIYEGDAQGRVLAKCGEPSDITRSVAWRPSGIWRYGHYFASDSGREVPVEVWTYNRGPNQFVRRLHFEDGELVEIETMGYGYNE